MGPELLSLPLHAAVRRLSKTDGGMEPPVGVWGKDPARQPILIAITPHLDDYIIRSTYFGLVSRMQP